MAMASINDYPCDIAQRVVVVPQRTNQCYKRVCNKSNLAEFCTIILRHFFSSYFCTVSFNEAFMVLLCYHWLTN